jgi:cell division protein FtsN
MSLFACVATLVLSAGPASSEVLEDLDAHPWHPAPAAASSTETAVRPAPTAPVVAPVPPIAAAPVAPKPPVAPGGTWQLQLGALQNPEAAAAEKKRLEKILGAGTVEILVDGGTHRLRYGRFASKAEAEQARASLKARNIDGFPAPRP